MQIHFIFGTDEENSWRCMDRYFATEPMPDLAFSPDAEFPVINGEKGVIELPLRISGEAAKIGDDGKLLSFGGGIRSNIVPEHAYARIQSDWRRRHRARLADFLAESEAAGHADEDGDVLILLCDGALPTALSHRLGSTLPQPLLPSWRATNLGGRQ